MDQQGDVPMTDGIRVRLTPEEKTLLSLMAEARGCTISDLVRESIDSLIAEARRAREVFARKTA